MTIAAVSSSPVRVGVPLWIDASGKIGDVYKKFDITTEAVVRAAHETLAEVGAA